jgi:hypothetical protein
VEFEVATYARDTLVVALGLATETAVADWYSLDQTETTLSLESSAGPWAVEKTTVYIRA